jgi:hypothetical protein
MQCKWYRSVLETDVDAVNSRLLFYHIDNSNSLLAGLTGRKEGKTRSL